MIDWSKRNVCDSCDVISSKKNPIVTYTLTLSRTRKSFTLCENCVKELNAATHQILNERSDIE